MDKMETQLEEITALNEKLAAANAVEREYNDIIATAGFGIWHIYLKDGVAPRMKANEKMAELLGIDTTKMTEEEVYDAWYSRITPNAIPSVQQSVGEMMQGKLSENTYLWTHPTKGDIYVRCGGTCIKQPDGTNMLRGYHADVTDIVFEDKRRTEELEKARKVADEERANLADAYGMIFGLSHDYHTIWVVSKETSKMRLVRSSGVSTIKNAVQMGIDLPEFDTGFDKYINTYVEPQDRERMHREIAFAEILRQLKEKDFFAVNYLRRDDSGHVGYHQIAFANADTADGKKQFVYGFRDIDEMVAEEKARNEELNTLNLQLEENQAQLEEASAEQEAQIEEINALNAELQNAQDQIMESFGIAEALSYEYHTIWLVDKETFKMKLIRTSGKSTLKSAVKMGLELPDYDSTVKSYVKAYVEDEDKERAYREMSSEEVLRHLEENGTYTVNYLRHDDKGNVAYHQMGFVNIDSGYGKKQFVLGFRDIDKMMKEEKAQKDELRRAKAEADAANIAKTSFLNSMSHDIRTPMNGIIGMTTIAAAHLDDKERVRECLGKVSTASKHLLSLINEILDISRIESGRMELAEEEFNVSQMIDNIETMLTTQANAKYQQLTVTVNNLIHENVKGDLTRLQQIFTNIIGNAIKYTQEQGNISVQFQEQASDSPEFASFQFICKDNGFGMSQKTLDNLFVPFERASDERVQNIQGTGLGMVITKNIINMMGGDIHVESTYGKGSTFTVTFQLKKLAEDISDKTATKDVYEELRMFDEKDFSDRRLLLVEDNELNREIATEIIRMTGATIETAENGKEALQKFENSEPDYYDMILMDIQMPVMDGNHASRAIRTLNRPDAVTIPIVAMSANVFVEDKKTSLSAGMNDHIAKPIDPEKLMGVMEKYLGTKTKESVEKKNTSHIAKVAPARYYEELYLTNGSTIISAESERACLEVLEKNDAVGIFGLYDNEGFPIYSVSGFALTALGYTFEELMEETGGMFIQLVHEDDRERLYAEFKDKNEKHQYRIMTKTGDIVNATSYSTDTFVMDGSKVRMMSLHIEKK